MPKNPLTRVRAGGFMGGDLDEVLAPRLLIVGRNATGKTTRLQAILHALSGPPGRDGLLPFAHPAAQDVFVEVSATTGLVLRRETKISRDPDGKVSVKNRSVVEPSFGEKTARAIDTRVEKDLAPNLIAVDLDRLWGLSAKDRRRTLLGLVSSMPTSTADDGGMDLDPVALQTELGVLLVGNSGWLPQDTEEVIPQMMVELGAPSGVQALVQTAGMDGLAYLSAVEGAAGALASRVRSIKTEAEALASTRLDPIVGNRESLEKERDEVRVSIEGMVEARAKAGARASEPERIATRLGVLTRDLPDWLGTDLDPQERIDAVVEKGKAAAEEVVTAETAATEAEAAWAAAREATEEAKTEQDAAAYRLQVLGEIRDHAEGPAGECPVCGSEGYDGTALADRIGKAEDGLAAARAKTNETGKVRDEAASALSATSAEAQGARNRRDDLLSLHASMTEAKGLHEEYAAVTAEADEGVATDEVLQAERDRLADLDDAVAAHVAHEEKRAARGRSVDRATAAAALLKDLTTLGNTAGPKGLQGEALASTLGPLQEAMNVVWKAVFPLSELGIRLTDARGNPDAEIVREIAAGSVGRGTLSGGEKAVAAAAFILALARAQPDRTAVALVEAGEVDGVNLEMLCEVLGNSEMADALANVVVATHVAPPPTAEGDGWTVRSLSATAGVGA